MNRKKTNDFTFELMLGLAFRRKGWRGGNDVIR